MAWLFLQFGGPFPACPLIRALLFGVSIRAPDFCKPQHYVRYRSFRLLETRTGAGARHPQGIGLVLSRSARPETRTLGIQMGQSRSYSLSRLFSDVSSYGVTLGKRLEPSCASIFWGMYIYTLPYLKELSNKAFTSLSPSIIYLLEAPGKKLELFSLFWSGLVDSLYAV